MDVRDEDFRRGGRAARDRGGGKPRRARVRRRLRRLRQRRGDERARARAQFETNYFGTLLPLRAVLPAMRARKAGRIVVVGSLAGRAPIPFQAHYSASKAALDALVLSAPQRARRQGVPCASWSPGTSEPRSTTGWTGMGRRRAPTATGGAGARRWCASPFPAPPVPRSWPRSSPRALAARRPRVRYTVGPDSLAVPLGRRLLPDALALALIRRHFEA